MRFTARQLIRNVITAIGMCLTAHSLYHGSVATALSRGETWIGVGVCVVANLAGLFHSARAASAPPARQEAGAPFVA